jgi:hypothetical protein
VQGVKKITELNAVPGGFLERSNQLIEKKKRLTQVRTLSARLTQLVTLMQNKSCAE